MWIAPLRHMFGVVIACHRQMAADADGIDDAGESLPPLDCHWAQSSVMAMRALFDRETEGGTKPMYSSHRQLETELQGSSYQYQYLYQTFISNLAVLH